MARVKYTGRKRPGGRVTEPQPPVKVARTNIEFAKTIDVVVGEQQVKFTIHPDLICARSSYFEAAAKRWYAEREPVTLRYDEQELFKYYLESIYADEIAPFDEFSGDAGEEYKRLLKLYILADRLGDLTTANAAIDRIMYFTVHEPTYEDVEIEDVLYVWRHTHTTSPLRRFVVHCFVITTRPEALRNALGLDDLPRDFLVAAAQRLAELMGDGHSKDNEYKEELERQPRCTYHQHDDMHKSCSGGRAGDADERATYSSEKAYRGRASHGQGAMET